MALFPMSDILTTLSDNISKGLRVKGESLIKNKLDKVMHTNVEVTSSITRVINANPNRNYLLIINDSDTTVYLSFTNSVGVNNGIRLNANGGCYEMSNNLGNLFLGEINATHNETIPKRLLVTQGSLTPITNEYLFADNFVDSSSLSNYTSYSNIATTGAVITENTTNIISENLSILLRSNQDKLIVIREFFTKSSFIPPKNIGDELNIEIKVKYPTVYETQFGIGVASKVSNGGMEGCVNPSSGTALIRCHCGMSNILPVNYIAVQHKLSDSPMAISTQKQNTNLVANNYVIVKMTYSKTDTGYQVKFYQDGELQITHNYTSLVVDPLVPYFYVASSSPTSTEILIDSFKVW